MATDNNFRSGPNFDPTRIRAVSSAIVRVRIGKVGNCSLRLRAITTGCPRARICPSTVDIYPSEDWQRNPEHEQEEQKTVADVSGHVCHETDDQRTDKRGRLGREPGQSVCLRPFTDDVPCR